MRNAERIKERIKAIDAKLRLPSCRGAKAERLQESRDRWEERLVLAELAELGTPAVYSRTRKRKERAMTRF